LNRTIKGLYFINMIFMWPVISQATIPNGRPAEKPRFDRWGP